MAEIPRLNGIIGQLEQNQVAFIAGSPDNVDLYQQFFLGGDGPPPQKGPK